MYKFLKYFFNETALIKRGRAVAFIEIAKKTLKPINFKKLARFRATLPKLKISNMKTFRKLRDEGY